MPEDNFDAESFLPDFCSVRVVFLAVVLAQLLAFVLALSPTSNGDRWLQLSLTSLFIQWVTLANCAFLCGLRRYLWRLRVAVIVVLCFIVVLLVTLLISGAGLWIGQTITLGGLMSATNHTEFVLQNLGISAIIAAAGLRYFYLQHQLRLSIQARSKAQIEALQARIRPHFLFNSMNTIASLTRSKPALAEQIVEDLADLFRASLAVDDTEVELQHEIALCHRYLNIEKSRLGERLQVEWSVDDEIKGVYLPTLSIQPLLENAIYHGIEPSPNGGTIIISGHTSDSHFELSVTNPVSTATSGSNRRRHQMALQNIRDRLKSLYGDQGILNIIITDQLFNAKLIIPLRVEPGPG